MADAEEPSQSSEQVSVCSFFRKPSKNKNIRKRIRSNSDDENDKDDDTSAIESIRNEKKPQTGLSFSTGGVASANKTAATSDASRGGGPVFHFESSREIQVENDSRATATLETETDFSSDARAIRERVLKQAEEALNRKPSSSLAKSTKQQQHPGGEEKVYKGIHGYTDFKAGFRREQTVASEKAGGSHGPLRASAHIRTSVRFDYQPDICKDYKETGYCGYGDSCKFMHDRGDYKSGWQMEREWEQAEKERKKKLAIREWAEGGDNEGGVVEDEDEDELPFACFICRNPFQDPVVTKCRHYFCEHCALKHYQTKSKNCFVCNKPTQGIFDTAHDIKKKMAKEK